MVPVGDWLNGGDHLILASEWERGEIQALAGAPSPAWWALLRGKFVRGRLGGAAVQPHMLPDGLTPGARMWTELHVCATAQRLAGD